MCNILYNTKINYNTVSYYYQLISFLNTKNNFFILVILLLLFIKNKLKNHQKLLYCIYAYIYIYVLNINLDINKLSFQLFLNNINPNLNLLNGIMLIHPIILYVFYSFFLLEVVLLLQKINNFSKKVINCTAKQNTLKMCLAILLANILGG